MKYKLERKEHPDSADFSTFSLDLTFETREEYVYFHDKVAIKMPIKGDRKFIGDLYKTGNGEIDLSSGVVEIDI